MNKRTNRRTIWTYIIRTQFGFGLRFEDGLFYIDGDGCNNGFSYIRGIKIFVIKFSNGFYKSFSKSIEMSTSLGGILSVYKRKIRDLSEWVSATSISSSFRWIIG